MREITLHDTRSGELLALRPRDPGRVGIYACGPTVYSRIHIGNARPFVVFSPMKRFLEHEGLRVDLVVNVTDVNDKIYTAALVAGLPSEQLAREMTAAYVADTDALGIGRPDHEPLASETMDAIVAYIETLVQSGHAYVADYTDAGERRRDVLFRVRSDPAYGSLSHRDWKRWIRVRGSRVPSARRMRWTSRCGRRRSPGGRRVAVPLGAGSSGLAHRVLGDGREPARGWLRHPRRRLGSRLSPPRERGCPDPRGARRGAGQAVGPQRHDSVHRREDGQVGRQHRSLARDPRAVGTRVGAHVPGRRTLPSAADFLASCTGAGAGHVNRIREAGRRLSRGTSPADLEELRERFFAALARDFNTPQALAVLNEWIRAASSERSSAPGDSHLREMLAMLGFESLRPQEDRACRAPPRACASWRPSASVRGRERDFALGRSPAGGDRAAGLGGPRCARGPTDP